MTQGSKEPTKIDKKHERDMVYPGIYHR